MILLFYSNQCNFCEKLLDYLNKNNLNEYFNMINIDKINQIPDNITIVPTIIDTTIEAPLEGKKAFEYVINQKYFNRPTNNIDYWINNGIPKPNIEEDSKAVMRHNFNFSTIDQQLEQDQTINKQNINNKIPIVPKDKKSLTLLKLRR
jgi:hypothetical protein